MARVKRSDLGFWLEHIEPVHDPAWPNISDRGLRRFWVEAARVGMAVKQSSIMRGIGRDGKPVRDISLYTRMHRKSAMTKSGKGSPSAKPLVPGYTLSRTYQYLRALPEPANHRVWFQWRHDPKTGVNWGQILKYQAAAGRDHFGFAFAEWNQIVETMDRWWRVHRGALANVERPRVEVPSIAARPVRVPPFRRDRIVTIVPTHIESATKRPPRRSRNAIVSGWMQFR